MIGYACCGSFCTLSRSMKQMELLAKQYELFPIVSPSVASTDTRFGKAADFLDLMEAISEKADSLPLHATFGYRKSLNTYNRPLEEKTNEEAGR